MSETRKLFESFKNNLNESQGRKLSFEEYKDLYDPYCNLTDDELYSMWQTDKDKLYTDEEIEQIKSEVEGFFDMEESALNEAIKKVDANKIKSELETELKKFMTEPDRGFDAEKNPGDKYSAYYGDYCGVEDIETNEDGDYIIHVYAEVSFDSIMELAERLNKIITKYDKEAYFDVEDSGRLVSLLSKNSINIINESTLKEDELKNIRRILTTKFMPKTDPDAEWKAEVEERDRNNKALWNWKEKGIKPDFKVFCCNCGKEIVDRDDLDGLDHDLDVAYCKDCWTSMNESALNESERTYKKGDTVYWIGAGNEISSVGQIIDFPDKERMTIKWDDGEVNTYSIGHPDIEHADDYTELEPDLNENVDYNNCVYQLVGGDYAGTYTREEAEKLPIKEDKLSPNYSEYRNNGGVVPREELDDQLQFKGYLGPMYNGTDKDGKHVIRYETQEVYDMMSESALNEKYSYKEVLEKELEKVQNSIGNAAPDKNISGLEDKRDWLMWKLDQLDEGDSLEKVRKDSIEKGLLSEDYNPLNVKLFMNTWGNYNVNGADVDSIGGGWMDIEQAKDFLEKHSDEEPFINDVDGDVPFEINEYSNVEQVIEWLEAYENLSDNEQEAFSAIMEDQNDDFESAMDILESGDYVFFAGVDNEEDLGRAWVDMVGGIEGVSNPENYIDEDAYRESWREAAESSVREDNPDIDEDSDEFENLVEEWLNSVVDEQLQLDIDEGRDLSDYFDYEAFGRELYNDGFYFANTGAIQTL